MTINWENAGMLELILCISLVISIYILTRKGYRTTYYGVILSCITLLSYMFCKSII